MQLTKSEYMMYLKHPAWLWLKKHDKAKLPPPDATLQAIFDAGHDFEQYAEALFPGGVTLGFASYAEYLSLPTRTSEALAGSAPTIFQGRLEYGVTTCIFDVLTRVEGGYELCEIKSSTEVKDEHITDLAFQLYVAEGAGLVITAVRVIVVDTSYVRDGAIDPHGLTKVVDVTERVRAKLTETASAVTAALEVMRSSTRPDISPRHAHQSALKEWLTIFRGLHVESDPYSIYSLMPSKGDLLGELEDQGYERLKDIPKTYEFSSTRHARQVALVKLGHPVIDYQQIAAFLDRLVFPLYFFDYETMNELVPPFDGVRPYQQLPMQYSLHILREPGGELEHREFLHREATHPGPALLAQLRRDIGETGSVITWNESFEKGRNTELATAFPAFAPMLHTLNERIVDLMLPFSRHWYEDYRLLGSASIKKVLPLLVPTLSYKELAIGDGATAQRAWVDAVLHNKNPAAREQVLADLLTYCQLDTLAMVKIYEVLRALPA